jgi:tyrosine decarboxylase
MEPVDADALFLGPKSENGDFFREMLDFAIEDHLNWRKDFHPEDEPAVDDEDRARPEFASTLQRTRETLVELAANLQRKSMPWHSPRYLGHMISDTLMAANLAAMLTLLYNPNNCAYEASPATTLLELEAGSQIASMLGFDPARAFGHITSGGTVANYEGLWMARNLKSVPRALRELCPELVEGLDDWKLSNITPAGLLDLIDGAHKAGVLEELKKRCARGRGLSNLQPAWLIIPQTAHYSWAKAADLLGLGQENTIQVPVRADYRMDIQALSRILEECLKRRNPVLAVVAVVGSTEEGAVDEVHAVREIRDEMAAKGLSFFLHLDAAYGGYVRSIFLDEEGRFLNLKEIPEALRRYGAIGPGIDWPPPGVAEAYEAVPEADFVTVDPHKLGYVPYSAGAAIVKDRRALDLVSYFAPYVFEKTAEVPQLLGSYILEGSKPGTAAAAVWAAHRVVPLNVAGYGRLLGHSLEGAARFHQALIRSGKFKVAGKLFRAVPLAKPDLNIVDFAFHEEGEKSLGATNRLNRRIYDFCSYRSGPVYAGDFITSKTTLDREQYGDTPRDFTIRMGLPPEEWDGEGSVFVLRSCILTPYLARKVSFESYWKDFMAAMARILEKAVASEEGTPQEVRAWR